MGADGRSSRALNWFVAIGTLLTGLAAVAALVVTRDTVVIPPYPPPESTTTSTGGSVTTIGGSTAARSTARQGRPYTEVKAELEREGWSVRIEPALVSGPRYSVVSIRPFGPDGRTLLLADTESCIGEGAAFEFCDGRPVAEYSSPTARPVRVGERVEVTDASGGQVTRRMWKWRQGDETGVFASEDRVMAFTVGGPPGKWLEVTLEVHNDRGTDEVTHGWEVAG